MDSAAMQRYRDRASLVHALHKPYEHGCGAGTAFHCELDTMEVG
jgi:hypothetical protein